MLNNNQPIGPGMQLSVGRADTIRAEVFAYYENNSGFSSVFSPAEMIAAVAGTFGGSEGAAGEAGQVFDGINEAIGGLMGVGGSNGDNIPAAYLSYILLDQNYNFVDGGYQSISVNANNNPELLTIAPIVVNQPGILYVYVSNESNSLNPVYFDDLKVTVSESPVLETTDYYPFGMTSESYQKPGMVDQKFKYNGKERINDLGLGWDDFGWRMYDPTIVRWNRIDDKSDNYYSLSPYNYLANSPLIFIDPDGNEIAIVGTSSYRTSVIKALANLAKTPEGARIVESLRKSKHVVVIHRGRGGKNQRYASGTAGNGQRGSWVYFDPELKGAVDGVKRVPYISLGHELRHSEQGFGEDERFHQDERGDFPRATHPNDPNESIPLAEVDAVDSENKIRASAGEEIRNSYDGFDLVDIEIDGKKLTVRKKDYESYSGKTAVKKFNEIVRSLNKNRKTDSNTDNYRKKTKFSKDGYQQKFDKDDKATVIY